MSFIGKIESVNNKSGFAWYSPVFCSRQWTGHCSRHEKTKLSPEHKGQRNDWTCEETLETCQQGSAPSAQQTRGRRTAACAGLTAPYPYALCLFDLTILMHPRTCQNLETVTNCVHERAPARRHERYCAQTTSITPRSQISSLHTKLTSPDRGLLSRPTTDTSRVLIVF